MVSAYNDVTDSIDDDSEEEKVDADGKVIKKKKAYKKKPLVEKSSKYYRLKAPPVSKADYNDNGMENLRGQIDFVEKMSNPIDIPN